MTYISRFWHKLLSPQIQFDIYDKFTDRLLDKELAFDVQIQDINDNPPQFVAPSMIFNVNENAPEGELYTTLISSIHETNSETKKLIYLIELSYQDVK